MPPRPAKIRKFRPKNVVGFLAGIGLSLAIFTLGINVGNGNIRLERGGVQTIAENSNLPADLDYTEIEQLYDTLKRSYDGDLQAETLIEGLKEGLAKATGDQYTEYFDAQEAQEFDNQLEGTFTGIGAELGKQNEVLTVIAPLAGFPAEQAGLRAQDVITRINDETAYDLSVSEAVNKIRGEVGTSVKLTVIRGGEAELEFNIVRQQITVPSVTSEILPGSIGYLKVSRYGEDTAQLSRQAARQFKDANVKGVILDVRNNPGGLLESSVDLASLWLPAGKTVLQEKRGGEVIRTYTAQGTATLQGVPTVVLINEGSASASEITAGALKDNQAATLVGEKTFGKGSVQQLQDLIGGGVLKVTIARWFTPAGKNIDQEGIEPDQKVERTDEDYTANRDPQQQAAIDRLNQ